MSGQLVVRRQGGPPERFPILGAVGVGGSPRDAIRIEGAPEGALRFRMSPQGAMVEAGAPGAHVSGRPLAAGALRLLRPGEEVRYLGQVFEIPRQAPPESTRALAGRLLREAAAGGDPVAGPHLLVVEGPQIGGRIPLGELETLGRGRNATARIADPLASRLHARIVRSADGYAVEDLGSKNGLRVNGALLAAGARPLRDGDEIALGSTFLVLCHPGPDRARPPAAMAADGATGELLRGRALAAAAALLLASALALGLAALGS
jgi:hypothetical protein